MSASVELVRVFARVLELCKVKDTEALAVLTENGERQAYADAYLVAAQEIGAQCFQVNVPRRVPPAGVLAKQTSLTGNLAAIAALKSTDIVIDLLGLLWSAEQREIQDAGTRILAAREPVEIVTRMFPTIERRRRVEAAERRLKAAREMRITSRAGTDITYRLGQYPVVTQYGYTDQPGRWDNLSAGGFLYTGGNDGEEGVNGIVVINTGDMILYPAKRYVANPIRLVVEAGRVARIEGDNLDAEILREYVSRFGDPRAYAVSHIGWGLDETARWEFLGTSPLGNVSNGPDGRAFFGNVLFSTGPNIEIGGSNDTACHLDIPLRGCDLMLDGEAIIRAGSVLPADMRP